MQNIISPRKTVVLFDGFNLYHALIQRHGSRRPYAGYKWLDYRALADALLSRHEALCDVVLFTTYARDGMYDWKQKRARHAVLLKVQRDRRVRVIRGRFARREVQCLVPLANGGCQKTFSKYEEKRTDVNIAVSLVEMAFERQYENALIVSADSDLIPAVAVAKRVHQAGRLVNVAPVGRHMDAQILASECDAKLDMTEKHLKAALMPRQVALSTGEVMTCPSGWTHG
jgi:uncharacterized LabA/DUF88 family protein